MIAWRHLRRFICVTPLESIVKSPKGKQNVAAAENAAARLSSAGVAVINVQMGRVLGLGADGIEKNALGNMYYSLGMAGLSGSNSASIPWIHANDAVNALNKIATSPLFARKSSETLWSTVVLDASKPLSRKLLEAEIKYDYTDLKDALA